MASKKNIRLYTMDEIKDTFIGKPHTIKRKKFESKLKKDILKKYKIKINPELNKLAGQNLFPKKVDEANAMLKKSRLPKRILAIDDSVLGRSRQLGLIKQVEFSLFLASKNLPIYNKENLKNKQQRTLPNVHPGDVLLYEFIIPKKWSLEKLNAKSGLSILLLAKIIKHKSDISNYSAKKLGLCFGMSEQFWLGLQKDYDNEEMKKITPKLKALIGSVKLPKNFDIKKEYGKHLIKKYGRI